MAKYKRRWKGPNGKYRYEYIERGSLKGTSHEDAIQARKEADQSRAETKKRDEKELATHTSNKNSQAKEVFGITYDDVDAIKGKGASDDKYNLKTYMDDYFSFSAKDSKHGGNTSWGKKAVTAKNRVNKLIQKWKLKKSMEDRMDKVKMVVVPGEIEPLEKAKKGVSHPAGVSKVDAPMDTNNPPASHRERMKFAKMAAERMLPKGNKMDAPASGTADHIGREAGGKAPYAKFSDNVSGEKSEASGNYAKQTYVVKPSELAAGTPESAKAHQPKAVKRPKC
jgi:hypothetical protein